MSAVAASAVLRFWFDGDDGQSTGEARAVWFRKDPAFDREIARRFGATIEEALGPGLGQWSAGGARERLALIIVLDQFTRNVYRDTPRMFAGDSRALAVAGALVDAGLDAELDPLERWFAYLPFEHSESVADQQRSVELFAALRAHPASAGAYDWAVRHRDVVLRFGRFPHRNVLLGRESTPDELAFLATPGSRF